MVKTMMDGMSALGRAEDVKTRMKETGVDTKNRTDLVAKMPWAEQSFKKNHTYSTDLSPEV